MPKMKLDPAADATPAAARPRDILDLADAAVTATAEAYEYGGANSYSATALTLVLRLQRRLRQTFG
jgi:hypothetical protein